MSFAVMETIETLGGSRLELRAEGKSLRDMLDNAFLYEVLDDGSEQLLTHYSSAPEPIFAKCVLAFSKVDSSAESEVRRAH